MPDVCAVQIITFCWICRSCGKEGPWQTDPEIIPKGFILDETKGLQCISCNKKKE